ncbi:hypothetical protein ACFXKC_57010 [Streptomyces sp. NPDC059340]|uniref:hypothetical protein n=1 Tax=Streptomyces sp. NPDC059340 TaxID=3346806 RepID=UPI003675537B
MGCRVARVAVLSAGSWGPTMTKVFADVGSDVTIHARRPEVVAEINVRHQNARYLPDVVLPDVVLPDRLRATVDPVEALTGGCVGFFGSRFGVTSGVVWRPAS